MNKDEDYIGFYRDAVIAGHDAPITFEVKQTSPFRARPAESGK